MVHLPSLTSSISMVKAVDDNINNPEMFDFELDFEISVDLIIPFKALRICCQDMFFGRSRSCPNASVLTGSSFISKGGKVLNPLHNAFRYTETTVHRLNVVEELFNVKVNQPMEKDVSNEVRPFGHLLSILPSLFLKYQGKD